VVGAVYVHRENVIPMIISMSFDTFGDLSDFVSFASNGFDQFNGYRPTRGISYIYFLSVTQNVAPYRSHTRFTILLKNLIPTVSTMSIILSNINICAPCFSLRLKHNLDAFILHLLHLISLFNELITEKTFSLLMTSCKLAGLFSLLLNRVYNCIRRKLPAFK
jgi:hypothetical protein